MNPSRCRIVIGPDDVRAYVPYDAREIVKALPVRRWDKALRCWIISADSVSALRQLLEADGRTVATIRLDNPLPIAIPQQRTPAKPSTGLAAARAAAAAASQRRPKNQRMTLAEARAAAQVERDQFKGRRQSADPTESAA